MPPKRSSDGVSTARGRPKGSKNKPGAAKPADDEQEAQSSDPFASSDNEEGQDGEGRRPGAATAVRVEEEEEEEGDEQPEKTIPRDLLTRLLHEFFAKDATRISKDANTAVGKYVDVFVREAIARTAVEKRGGFLEVDDLEKVTPQLLLDL
ncbi:Centromere protein X-like protein [Hapsidospora chrysogenum ATCC 11550]|uniref:Centromere protein X-like protein n=1 Tax=Hapsidospora chrysogenum (strain ATCC 11550 / CBS 779.69 / DSM 880 / IAM 14645 / JCM 23072 / IMI 49137) TaxID=857340 RepID=A0A086T239_HAPC1|nr:Centromere protein X-like protein [Hapsidospora chrysogenum ATCC 11550]